MLRAKCYSKRREPRASRAQVGGASVSGTGCPRPIPRLHLRGAGPKDARCERAVAIAAVGRRGWRFPASAPSGETKPREQRSLTSIADVRNVDVRRQLSLEAHAQCVCSGLWASVRRGLAAARTGGVLPVCVFLGPLLPPSRPSGAPPPIPVPGARKT